jgi:hypothetical protein
LNRWILECIRDFDRRCSTESERETQSAHTTTHRRDRSKSHIQLKRAEIHSSTSARDTVVHPIYKSNTIQAVLKPTSYIQEKYKYIELYTTTPDIKSCQQNLREGIV